ncbi:MAG: putative integral rane protein [Acidimicrobiales bacterium]|nr:putative integral rane protein [Acidimicrobiales bacterium]
MEEQGEPRSHPRAPDLEDTLLEAELGAELVDPIVAIDPGETAPGKRKARLVLAARLVISALLLWVLIMKIGTNWSEAIPDATVPTFAWLAGALALTFGGVVLSAVRWKEVLAALGQRPPFTRLLSLYFAGQFMGNVLPSTIGGDALRVSRLSKETGEAPTTFASVVLERLSGWLVLPVITLGGLAVNPGLRDLGQASAIAFGTAVGTLVLLGIVLLLTARPGQGLEGRLEHSQGWRRFTTATRYGIHRLTREPAAAARILASGFAYQFILIGSALMAARALGLPAGVGPTAVLAFVPAVLIAQVLPISISGLGVREGLFALFLHPLGVPRSQAIALGLLLYLLNLVVSLFGAPAFAVGNRPAATPAAA